MRKNSFYFQWHITNVCGNRCKHCYLPKYNSKNVSLEDARKILADMNECCKELDAEMILSITGGDPITHPQLWEILKEAKKYATKLAILGNPEMLDKDTLEKLAELKIDRFQLSLDGLEKTHDYFRRKGSFNRTTAAVKALKDVGIPVIINSTVSNLNINEMGEVMKLAYELGAKKWSFARWVPDSGTCGITKERYLEFLKEIARIQKEEIDSKEFLSGDPLMNSINCDAIPGDTIIEGCALGSSVLCILEDNEVMACRRHRDSHLGKWAKKGDLLNFFLFNPKMESYRQVDKIIGCSKCDSRSICRGCRALAYADTGDSFGKDPQCAIIDQILTKK